MRRYEKNPPMRKFTLIELLVVIVIIAILISMLLPSLNRAKAKAKMITCLSNQRQIAIQFTKYTSDYQGWMPVAGHYYSNGSKAMGLGWMIEIEPGFETVNDVNVTNTIYECPTFMSSKHDATLTIGAALKKYAPHALGRVGGISYNRRLGYYDDPAYEPWNSDRHKITEVSEPSETILTTDAKSHSGGSGGALEQYNLTSGKPGMDRHIRMTPMALIDGHGEIMRTDEVWTDWNNLTWPW